MPSNKDEVRETGGQVDNLVFALIDSLCDKDELAEDLIRDSLVELGKKKTDLVISSTYYYLKKNSKLPISHRVAILNCMERILKECLDVLDMKLASSVIDQALKELTTSKEIVPEWQSAASGVLVALGARYCNEVMEVLVQNFKPGVLPHFFIVQTMSNLSTANVFDMMPHINASLGAILPMMGMAKQDNMRWVFCNVLQHFSESILEYIANIEKAPDPNIRKVMFSREISAAYDILFNVWLQSKEAKLRLAVIEAIGPMTHIMNRSDLEEQLPKLISGILALYKKHQVPFHITQALCMVLDAGCSEGSMIMEPYLENLYNTLFPQITAPLDYENPMSVKNYNEVLRCFTVISQSFSSKLMSILLQKLESNNEKTRIGILSILKHLINAGAGSGMDNMQELLLSGLKILLSESNNKVKKVLAQVIIAMAHHKYLENEGGHLMIEFIVNQCCLPNDTPNMVKRRSDMDYVSNESLRSMCDNILHLITTTIECMEPVLWPFLLEFVVSEHHFQGIKAICRSLAHLAKKKKEENADDYDIDFENLVNMPKQHAIIARLLTISGDPLAQGCRGIHVLNFLKHMAPNLCPELTELWNTVIPKLVCYLEDNSDDKDAWVQKNWEDLVLKMLSKSLEIINNEEWVESLGEAFGQQIHLYANLPNEKNFLYKCLGIILRNSTKKEFISKQFDLIFSTVKHSIQKEREGCAFAMGFAATSHLDAVLERLQGATKQDMVRKSSGILGFMRDRNETDVEKVKATLILCYGHVTLFAPNTLLISRMEMTILKAIYPFFTNPKDMCVKLSLIKATELIGQSLSPKRLKTSYKFLQRGDILEHLQLYIKGESKECINNEVRTLAINAATTLVQLEPKLSEKKVDDLIESTTSSILCLPQDGCTQKKGKDETYEELVEAGEHLKDAINALNNLLTEILRKDLTPDGLEVIFKHLKVWLTSSHDYQRERVLETWLLLLKFFRENVNALSTSDFSNVGLLLANLIPRCSDPVIKVRKLSLECVHTILEITMLMEGLDPNNDAMLCGFQTLNERIEKSDTNILYVVAVDISKVVAKKLPKGQLMSFLKVLEEGLVDPLSHSSSGSCVMLTSLMKQRGRELREEVSTIIERLHERLETIQYPQSRTGTLRALRTVISQHLPVALKCLLSYPIPYDNNVCAIWCCLAEDPQLVAVIVDQLLENLLAQRPYEERGDNKEPTHYALIGPLSIMCAFEQMLTVAQTESVVIDQFHRLFSAMILIIGSLAGAKPPRSNPSDNEPRKISPAGNIAFIPPSSLVVKAFRMLLERANLTDVSSYLQENSYWTMFEDVENYPEAFTALARSLAQNNPTIVPQIVITLHPALPSYHEPQRVVTASFYAELINQKCPEKMALIESIINGLLSRMVDSSHIVRMYCIRGLGNIASMGKDLIQKYSTTVLSALMSGLDDKEDINDNITMEAMGGLSRVMSVIDEEDIRSILINVILKIRPCFEKEVPCVRAEAILLFGNLSRFGGGQSKAAILEQIHSNFVSLLLHLNDGEVEVRKACKFTLRSLGSLLDCPKIDEKFQKLLLDDANLYYGEFMNDISKLIIKEMPDKINQFLMSCMSFYNSIWPEIRANAAMFSGFLLGNLTKESYNTLPREHICTALIDLLKDPSPQVRGKAAEAMSLLYNY
ncbi:maestro heat-like repeat-containing protein family member 1 isoform X2 [Argonauta hians]